MSDIVAVVMFWFGAVCALVLLYSPTVYMEVRDKDERLMLVVGRVIYGVIVVYAPILFIILMMKRSRSGM